MTERTITAPWALTTRIGLTEFVDGVATVDDSSRRGSVVVDFAIRHGWKVDPKPTPRPKPAVEPPAPASDAAMRAEVDAARKAAEKAQADAASAAAAAAAAQERADNARQMVLNRDDRLGRAVTAADSMEDILAASNAVHADLEQRLANVKTTPGKDGRDGIDGQDGTDGTDGEDGNDGKTGASAYELARSLGYTGTLAEWLASLKGERGPAGGVQFEFRDGVPVPQVLSLLGLSVTVDVPVVWPSPFPDSTYTITPPQVTVLNAGLIGKIVAGLPKSKTPTGCVVPVTTTALLSTGQAVLSVFAIRKA